MTVRLAHVGIAVHSIPDARNFYEEVLGLEVEEIEEIPSEGVKAAMLPFPGGMVELLEPLEEDTPVGRFLEKHGEGLHHLSFDVPDIHETIMAGVEHGVETVGEAPRTGGGGREIAFFHPLFTHGVLIEVSEPVPGAERFDSGRELRDLGRRLRSLVEEVDEGVRRARESEAAERAREGAREAGRKARSGLADSLRRLGSELGSLADRLGAAEKKPSE